jgi:hypothetical protein
MLSLLEVDIATEFTIACIAVYTHIDDYGTRLNHIGSDETLTTNSHNKDVSTTCHLGEVLGA